MISKIIERNVLEKIKNHRKIIKGKQFQLQCQLKGDNNAIFVESIGIKAFRTHHWSQVGAARRKTRY